MRIAAIFLPLMLLAFLPGMAIGHGSDAAPSAGGGGSRKSQERPRHKSEEAALKEMSFLVRDLEKRMRRGDVEGVHEGAWEIAATADNLWMLGENKKVRAPNRMTINGYMNLLKGAVRELEAFAGADDSEAGRTQLARVREIFNLLYAQYHPNQVDGPDAPAHDSGSGASDSGKGTYKDREPDKGGGP